jgi:selenocysteine-specific elongation factor
MPRTPEKRVSPGAATAPSPATGVPPRLAVVGTAGHIDHGKTALVRRLTVWTPTGSRKRRSAASASTWASRRSSPPGGAHVGIVDVPGHERFVKNMLAGVGGVDLGAARDRRRRGRDAADARALSIVKLLGVERGVIALTKRDLVDDDWARLVTRDVRALVSARS